MIKLVPFYKDINLDIEGIELNEMTNVFDYKGALKLFESSFHKFNPYGKFQVATDMHTQLNHSGLFRTDLDGMNIMESLTVSNTHYVHNNEGLMVLCGADHLICNDVNNFFHGPNFDIGVFMNGDEVNNTVVLVAKNAANAKRVDRFFKLRQRKYYNLPDDIRLWYGDQKSLTEHLRDTGHLEKFFNDPIGKLKACIYEVDGLKVKFFEYGRFVKGLKKGGGLKENPTNILIDFKGPLRKQYHKDIYDYIMNTY